MAVCGFAAAASAACLIDMRRCRMINLVTTASMQSPAFPAFGLMFARHKHGAEPWSGGFHSSRG